MKALYNIKTKKKTEEKKEKKRSYFVSITAQKMKFSVKDSVSKSEQIQRYLS